MRLSLFIRMSPGSFPTEPEDILSKKINMIPISISMSPDNIRNFPACSIINIYIIKRRV